MRRTVRLAVLAAALGSPPLRSRPTSAIRIQQERRRCAARRHPRLRLHGTILVVAMRSAGTCRALAWQSGNGTVTPAGVPCRTAILHSASRPLRNVSGSCGPQPGSTDPIGS